jgi:hypothetical protein
VRSGLGFAVVFGVTMWLLAWSKDGTSPLLAVALALFGGVLYGGFTAWYAARRRRRGGA